MLDGFMDCHAILGVSVNADFNEVRKRYLKIARRLHPDSFAVGDTGESEKEFATQLFSKWIVPAHATFAKERDRKEYLLLTQLKGKQAIQQKVSIAQLGENAQNLAAAENLDDAYNEALQSLAAIQYDNLAQTLAVTAQLSELNLVYLMRKESESQKSRSTVNPSVLSGTAPTGNSGKSGAQEPEAPSKTEVTNGDADSEDKKASSVDSYLRRAEEYIAKQAYAQAILELRDALRFAPNDSRCHSLMGLVYLKQQQTTMAKVSIKRALEINPKDPNALKAKQQLEKLGQRIEPGQRKETVVKTNKADDDKSGGLFGLFKGKKK